MEKCTLEKWIGIDGCVTRQFYQLMFKFAKEQNVKLPTTVAVLQRRRQKSLSVTRATRSVTSALTILAPVFGG